MRNNHDILPVTILCIFALVNAKASPAFGNARLAIERTTCDLGEVFDETPAKALFTVRHVGSSTLRLTPKKVSCGCVGVKSSEIVIPASSEATVPVTINVRGRRGRQNHSVLFTTNDSTYPELVLSVRASVRPLVLFTSRGVYLELTHEQQKPRRARITAVTALKDYSNLQLKYGRCGGSYR